MLVGGMFDVNVNLVHRETELKDFPLRFDENNEYSRKVYTNNGRTATTYAFLHGMKLEKGAKVLVPEYNCISVFNALEAADVEFTVYGVKKGLIIDTKDIENKITKDTKVIYLIHYFGVPQPKEVVDEIQRIAKEYGLYIVEDLTQTVLSKEKGRIGFGDYIVMSTRKWYPITDGGVVAARDGAPFDLVDMPDGYDEAVYRQLIISLERKYLEEKKNFDSHDYLQLEKEANKARYIDFTPKKMTDMSQNIFFNTDHAESVKKRRENYTFLYDNLQNIKGLEVWGDVLDTEQKYVPFGFMVTVDNRSEFYNFLANKGVIGEIQWLLPTQYYEPGEYASFLSDHSLMLQCDQRYGTKEMSYVVSVIKEYFETNRKEK